MGKVYEAEDYLIPPDRWDAFYDTMPVECQRIVDGPLAEPLGIGYEYSVGWFILGSGQGPGVCWAENPDKYDKRFGK